MANDQEPPPGEAEPPHEVIEGGSVEEFSDLQFQEEKHHAETAKLLAVTLVWVLAGSWLLHYATVALLLAYAKPDTIVQELTKLFHAWLPVTAGLVGAATTYYFTKENRR